MTDLLPLIGQLMGVWALGFIMGYGVRWFVRLLQSG